MNYSLSLCQAALLCLPGGRKRSLFLLAVAWLAAPAQSNWSRDKRLKRKGKRIPLPGRTKKHSGVGKSSLKGKASRIAIFRKTSLLWKPLGGKRKVFVTLCSRAQRGSGHTAVKYSRPPSKLQIVNLPIGLCVWSLPALIPVWFAICITPNT